VEPTHTAIPALDTPTPRKSQIQPTPTDTFAPQPTVAQPPGGQLTIWIDPHLPADLQNNLLMPAQLSPRPGCPLSHAHIWGLLGGFDQQLAQRGGRAVWRLAALDG
jgi:hypothetical protein